MSKAIAVIAYQKGYSVTESGEVINPHGGKVKACLNTEGYPYFRINANGSRRTCTVHALIAYSKFKDAYLEPGIVARHKDGNKENSRPDNILIGTNHDNWMDMDSEVRRAIAAKSQQKFTAEAVAEWREMHASGMSYRDISREIGINKSTLSYYLSRTAKKTSYTFPITEAGFISCLPGF